MRGQLQDVQQGQQQIVQVAPSTHTPRVHTPVCTPSDHLRGILALSISLSHSLARPLAPLLARSLSIARVAPPPQTLTLREVSLNAEWPRRMATPSPLRHAPPQHPHTHTRMPRRMATPSQLRSGKGSHSCRHIGGAPEIREGAAQPWAMSGRAGQPLCLSPSESEPAAGRGRARRARQGGAGWGTVRHGEAQRGTARQGALDRWWALIGGGH